MIDSSRRSDPRVSGGTPRHLLMDARRYGVSAPPRWTPAGGGPLGPPNPRGWSPSSRFLVSTENLGRGQDVHNLHQSSSVAMISGAMAARVPAG